MTRIRTVILWGTVCLTWFASGFVTGCIADKTAHEHRASAGKLMKIVYIETGVTGPTERYIIDLENESITYERSSDPWRIGKRDYRKKALSKKKSREIVEKLKFFTGEKWEKRYMNPYMADGDFWRLYLIFPDGGLRKISGANAWPENFKPTLCLEESRTPVE